jgi:hypothetical protein
MRYHPIIFLEGLWKVTGNLSQGSRCPGRDSNRATPEYEYRALLIRQLSRRVTCLYSFLTYIYAGDLLIVISCTVLLQDRHVR